MIAGRDDSKCSNTSLCANGYFCNYDYQYKGFCEGCPESVETCILEQLVNKEGVRDCEKSCPRGSHLPSSPGLRFAIKMIHKLI